MVFGFKFRLMEAIIRNRLREYKNLAFIFTSTREYDDRQPIEFIIDVVLDRAVSAALECSGFY